MSSNMDNCENSAADGVQWSDKRVSPDVCVCFAYIHQKSRMEKRKCVFFSPSSHQTGETDDDVAFELIAGAIRKVTLLTCTTPRNNVSSSIYLSVES